jgi:hypothetical protein
MAASQPGWRGFEPGLARRSRSHGHSEAPDRDEPAQIHRARPGTTRLAAKGDRARRQTARRRHAAPED